LWKQRVTGSADVECLVTVDGKVAEARVVSASRPEFGEAALEAVKQWEFEPGTRNGAPAQMRIRIPLNFAIGNEDSLESFLGRKLYQEIPGEIVRAESLTKYPVPKQLVQPRYPPALRGSGKKGKAVVSIVITPEGKVVNPKLVKATFPEFTFPALAAAASLEFPAQSKKDQEKAPIYVGMNVQFDFEAERGKPPEKKSEAPKKTAEKAVTRK
jgi:TonB family protein